MAEFGLTFDVATLAANAAHELRNRGNWSGQAFCALARYLSAPISAADDRQIRLNLLPRLVVRLATYSPRRNDRSPDRLVTQSVRFALSIVV